jgi:uncharacterized protein (DUF1015 family)
MAQIKPFKALRPSPEHAAKVASRPYDVMNRQEAKAETVGNPYSFLHITRSEIDLPDELNVHTEAVYTKAQENLKAFLSRDILFKESKPCYYIYRLTMNGRAQTGLVALSSVDDYGNNLIKKHEFTRPEKEQDRISHIVHTGAQTGNVFLAYRNVPAIDELITEWTNGRSPIYDFTADDAVHHSIWIVNSDEAIAKISDLFTNQVPATYIADGHHRAASAAKARTMFKGVAQEKAGWFLTSLFPANDLCIMDYNRVVTDLNGHSHEAFFEALSQSFSVEAVGTIPYKPEAPHHFGLYVNAHWYKLVALPHATKTDALGVLDVSVLQENLLEPILGIKDQRTDKRIDFVGGIRGLEALSARVNSGEMALAISLYPVSIHQLFDIADSGEVMPPKSTWFEPKLRDGLLTHVVGRL